MASLEPSPQHEELVGGKYRLGPIIGSGGIATVRRATHVWTEREVAVKLLDPTLPHFEQLRAGFLREARATVQLNHPNVVDVLDMGEDGWDTVYMVMELLHGPTLRDVLHDRGKLSEEDTLAILLPLLDALEKAHELGIIHRDFKPDNIMLPLDAYGVVTPKLLDFGIAEIVRDAHSQGPSEPEGVIMGTPEYMSPEQARDHRSHIGPHTDVWGAAVVWYECLTGHAPFEGDSAEEVLQAVCEAPIDFNGVPDQYVPLLRDALHRLPGFRMASVSDLKARIEKMGFERATVPPAPASLSSVPAPMPEPSTSEDVRVVNGTLVGLGPEQLFAPTPPAARVDSEVIRLPTRSNRGAWFAGAGLAVAVVLAAWWMIRDPGADPDAASTVVVGEPDPLPEDAPPEPEPEVLVAEEPAATRVDPPEELVATPEQLEARALPAPEESGVSSLTALDEQEAAARRAPEELEAASPAAPESRGVAQAAEKPVAEVTAPPKEPVAAPPEPEEAEAKPTKTKRARPRPKTRARKEPESQRLPDLVTEW